MTAQRHRIDRYVTAHPGVHFNELVRVLDLAPGQVQYHVRRLRRDDRLVAERLYGQTHYYPPTYDRDDRRAIALMRRETARDVLCYLVERGPTRPATVADDLDIARSTLEWHLDRLVEGDLVTKHRDERGRVTLALERPTATVALLDEIDVPLPDRLVDRFTRLVDRLLSEPEA